MVLDERTPLRGYRRKTIDERIASHPRYTKLGNLLPSCCYPLCGEGGDLFLSYQVGYALFQDDNVFFKKISLFSHISLDREIQSFYIWVVRLKDLNKQKQTTGVVAQFWLEHRPVTPEVASSSLVYPAKKSSRKRGLFVYGA